VYHDAPKITFRSALLAEMAKNHLDAIVYPTWSNPPRKVGDMASPAGDNSQVLSPQTGFPAITVPMGFTHGMLPAGLTFLGPAFSEGTLIRYAYDFEQTTKQRKDPPLFPPLH
jgi:Asp-tRNA(Asn)/Glu-tRNA(Gln) amidotransferase A subunit family amidase